MCISITEQIIMYTPGETVGILMLEKVKNIRNVGKGRSESA